jgi:tetraacyldisaccharide 4'-kinase
MAGMPALAAAQVYGLAVRLRRALYRHGFFKSQRFDVPVIVVGNVIAGGAGKTPLVIALVKHLQAQQVKVGVISRGYGRASADCIEVTSATSIERAVTSQPLYSVPQALLFL